MATSSGAQSLDAQSTGAGAGTSDSTREERHRIFRAALASASSGLQAAPPTTQPSPRTESGPSTAEPAPSQPNGRPAQVHVVVYTTPWCQYCKKAKAWMNSNGIAYEERDIELSSEYARSMRDINPGGGIPTFDIEGDVMVGFSPDGLTARMRSAAQRRSARSL
jgi:glutaredoxin